jgi:hypothetical protein
MTMTPSLFGSALQDQAPGNVALPGAYTARCCPGDGLLPTPAGGSRRRRLWELDAHAHCPVVGLCLPVAVMRRVMQRHATELPTDDYQLHCEVVGLTRRRNTVSEALQRELDTRHALALQAAARLKCTASLQTWWQAQRQGPQMASALWASLTHARCTPELEAAALGHVHMQQHEVGQMARMLADRQQQMQAEQARLAVEHRALAARLEEAVRSHARERDRLQAEAVQLRGQLLARDTRIAQLQTEAQALREAAPDLPARRTLAAQLDEARERALQLQRALDRARGDAERWREQAAAHAASAANDAAGASALSGANADAAGFADAADTADLARRAAPDLRERHVLCVGGRTSAVPGYRALLEGLGAQFHHHDGGQEHNPQRLQASLAAADLVICQAGCISHEAYWRVKDHCKRTGKRCVFVETAGAGALQRALHQALATGAAGGQGESQGESAGRSSESK